MIRNRDDADVGRSLRAFRHHAEVARRELARARARLARVEPLMAGGKHTRAIAAVALRRAKQRAELCAREVRYWLQAVDGILQVHLDAASRSPWRVPLVHDPLEEIMA